MKKRICSLFLVVSLILSALPTTTFATSLPSSSLYGDVNSDGQINMRDVLAMKQYIAGYGNSINKTMADTNDDGNIDAKDLLLLKKYIVGWDVTLGAPLYTITFNSNGGSEIASVKVKQNDMLSTVPSPSKADAIFLGWYTDSALTHSFYAKDAIVSNLTLYAKYAQTEKQEQFVDNTFTLVDQKPDLSFKIASTDKNMNGNAVLEGITLENVGNSDYIHLNVSGSNGDFTVTADGGFTQGAGYKLTLDNNSLKFGDKPQTYRICTFTIAKDEVVDIKLNNDLIYIKSDEISNIMSNGKAVDTLAAAVLGNTDTKITGSFNYDSVLNLKIGDALCIYQNVKPTDRNTTSDYSDDSVAYVDVTGISGTTVSFKSADTKDVIFLPDTLPVSESDMTSFDKNGSFTEKLDKLDFSKYSELGLDKNTTVDVGDYVVITEEDNTIVYGKVKSEVTNGDMITVNFDGTTTDKIQKDTMDYYTKTDANSDAVLKKINTPELEKQIETQAVQSGFAQSAMNYLASAATKTDGFKHVTGVENFIMTTPDGSVVNPTANQLKAIGGQYETDNIKVEATIDNKTEHFGKGLRAAVKVSGEITFNQGEDNEVVIDLSATFVEELKMSFNANGGAVWSYWKGFLPYISDYKMNANIDVYDYTGVSVAATVSLKEKDDESIDISDELKKLMNDDSNDENKITAGVQDLFDAYGDMLKNETDYVDIVDKELASTEAWVDPFCIIAYSFKLNFVLGANINLALGCNLDYTSGTRYNFWFAVKAKTAGNSTMDLMDETFNFQFYAMGHLGLRMGLKFEFAVGLFSTDLDSIGISAEAGPYVELFGYFFYDYNSVRDQGSSQAVTKSKMAGAIYLEFGIYLKVSFKAQVLNGKYSYNPTLYEHQWPLLHAGDQINVYDFGYEQPKADDVILLPDTTSTLPASIRYMNCMDLKDGELTKNEYDLDKFYYSLSNKDFVLDEKTGIIKVNVAPNVRYLDCDLTITWKPAKLTFRNGDLTRTIHLVWTNLTTSELKEKFDVSVKVGNNIVWNTRVIRGVVPKLPTEAEILKLIGYDKYVVDGTNLKYTGYTGYGDQKASAATGNQSYVFDVTERNYNLTVKNVQNADGTTGNKTFTAKFGENFDLSALASTGTSIAGTTYTKYFNTKCSSDKGQAATDKIDTAFATQLLSGTNTYTANYVDDSCKVTYMFNTLDHQSFSKVTETVKKGTVPEFNYSDYLMTQGVGYMVKEWDKTIGKVNGDTTFTATCCEPAGEKYTVTFETNDGSDIEAVQRYENAAITAPVVPTKTGYTFAGWYSDKELTKEYTFSKMPGYSFTLYAKWTANSYTVSFDANGGDCATDKITVVYGNTYNSLPVATRSKFAFQGWYTEAVGGEKVESNSKFAIANNQILYAHWLKKADVVGPDISPQHKTYNTMPLAFDLKGANVDGFTVKYKINGANEYSSNAINAGKYLVMITRPEDENYNAYEMALTDALVIDKAPRTINPPVSGTSLFRTISVTPVSDFTGYGDGAVEYSVGYTYEETVFDWSTFTMKKVEKTFRSPWTTSLSTVNLAANTPFYLYARVTEGENYLEATSVASVKTVTTGIGAQNTPSTYSIGIHTGTESGAGTDANVSMAFLYADGNSGASNSLDNSGDDFENNSYGVYSVTDSKDPWMISGINIGNDGAGAASDWLCDYVDVVKGGVGPRISVNEWFDNAWGNYYTHFYKRNITSTGSFENWGGTYDIDSNSAGNIEYAYDGQVTDQYGTYNAIAHDDAPQLYVEPSKAAYYDCFSYNINSFIIDKAKLYKKMVERGESQITFTINLNFDSRSSATTQFTKTVTINRH